MMRHFQSHLEGKSRENNTGEAGNTDTGARSPEMRTDVLCLPLCWSPSPRQYRSRGKGVVPPLSKLAVCMSITQPLLLTSDCSKFRALPDSERHRFGHLLWRLLALSLWERMENKQSLGDIYEYNLSLLSTPHSLLFHLASLHGPGQSWGEVTTLGTQGPQTGPPGVRDQESEWKVKFTILQWAHSSILAWKNFMAGYSPWGHKESATIERLSLSLSISRKFIWKSTCWVHKHSRTRQGPEISVFSCVQWGSMTVILNRLED